jgi:hypothetical protein
LSEGKGWSNGGDLDQNMMLVGSGKQMTMIRFNLPHGQLKKAKQWFNLVSRG